MITLSEILLLLPEIFLILTSFIILIVDLFSSKKVNHAVLASGGISVSIIFVIMIYIGVINVPVDSSLSFKGILSIDKYSLFFKVLILTSTLAISLSNISIFDKDIRSKGEFWSLFLLSLTGMTILSSTTEMITTWVALELTSLPLVGMLALSEKKYSLEVALKYLILSATSSAVILMGIAYLYGITGSTFFNEINSIGQTINGKIFSSQYNILLIFASILIISGISFKIASFPFMSWVPDVYQGAPTIITMYLSVVSKIAGFSILIRILFQALNSSSYEGWSMFVAIMALVSMITGNIMALRQRNIKRLFAYSTIAHAGYILIGIASIESSGSFENSIIGVQATIFYLVGYAVTNLTAFISIMYITDKINSNLIDDLKGIGFKFKSQSIILAISLISLLGIPLTIGFMGKAFIFSAAITNGFFWLSMAGIINSLVSAYYYIKVIKVMFVDISPDYEIATKTDNIYALAVTYLGVIMIFIIGLAPAFLLNLLESVVNTLLTN